MANAKPEPAGFAAFGTAHHFVERDQSFPSARSAPNSETAVAEFPGAASRYIVVELKNAPFKPEFVGKLNFYLSAVDDLLCAEHDNPSIGLLLYKTKNNVVAEYSLRDVDKPIGVSEYRLAEVLPEGFADALPSPEDIEKRL